VPEGAFRTLPALALVEVLALDHKHGQLVLSTDDSFLLNTTAALHPLLALSETVGLLRFVRVVGTAGAAEASANACASSFTPTPTLLVFIRMSLLRLLRQLVLLLVGRLVLLLMGRLVLLLLLGRLVQLL